ncbi:phenylalanine--tRNA ligase subunit beta [Candidatus Woesearchaeota archaeon]|nr:MAG: phenylalanine--tRNA ligase subunit beta [Candidatus Woesearchaeota archaeon]
MPTITFAKADLEKALGRSINEKILERISFLGMPVEHVDDKEIVIEVSPNRPDVLSLHGFSRAMRSFLGIKIGLQKYTAKPSSYKVIIDKQVQQVRPFTVCAVVKGLKLTDEKIRELIDLQEKVHITFGRNRKKIALGIYPLEKIKFPIRYTAKKPEDIEFFPLEINKKLTANQILALHPTGRKYAHLLEGQKLYPLFIDAKNQIMSMPPIINSNTVGKIDLQTKEVFIECSGFDFSYLSKSLNMIVAALIDMGGVAYQVTLQYVTKKVTPQLEPERMKLDPAYAEKILGVPLKPAQVKILLERMGFGYDGKTASIPSYRADILHPIDLVEDIAIAYGYENIPEKIPHVATIGKEDAAAVYENKIRDVLTGYGLLEVKNFSLTNKKEQQEMVLQNRPVLEIENAFSEEYSVLRRSFLPSLLATLKRNKHNEFPQHIFEIGTVFKDDCKEERRLCIALCNTDTDFTKIKQILDGLMQALNKPFVLEEAKDYASFINGRVAIVKVNNVNVAHIGEVHPQVLTNFELEMPVAVLEMNLELMK